MKKEPDVKSFLRNGDRKGDYPIGQTRICFFFPCHGCLILRFENGLKTLDANPL